MTDFPVISSDSHVMEPGDLWTSRLDRKWRADAPRVFANEDRPGYSFGGKGITSAPVSGGFAAGKQGDDYKEHLANAGYEAAHPGGWDPAARLEAQETDGVAAEVLYTTLGMRLYSMRDAEMQAACFATFNDWLTEYCRYSPARLHGIGMISLWDVERGVAELERCARNGLKGGMIWGWPPAEARYYDERYDPLWGAAQDLGMPLSLHVVTGMGEESRVDFSDAPMRYMNLIHEVQRSISDLVLGGVLERFPRLQIVSAESDTGWMPHFMQRLDRAHEKFGTLLGDRLRMKASEYVRRQVWATFLDDVIGAQYFESHGADTFMWGSDFPHSDSTWPDSQKVIEENMVGIPNDLARKILLENTARLYGIEESALARVA